MKNQLTTLLTQLQAEKLNVPESTTEFSDFVEIGRQSGLDKAIHLTRMALLAVEQEETREYINSL